MVRTKFIVHFASHQANQNSTHSVSHNGEKLFHETNFELEPFENFSSNFVRNLCICRTLFLLEIWSSESEI